MTLPIEIDRTLLVDRDWISVHFNFSKSSGGGEIWVGVDGFPGCWLTGNTLDEVIAGLRKTLAAYLTNNPLDDQEHIYMASACRHGAHKSCPEKCGHCGAPCVCGHHRGEDG